MPESPPARHLGDLVVPAVGFGVMVLSSGIYGDVDDETAERALATAIELGATFLDTSDAYGLGHNERLIGAWLADHHRDEVQIGTKFGFVVPEGEPQHDVPTAWPPFSSRMNAEPRLVRGYLEASLARLGTDHVDLYYPHFPDPVVPIEDTVEAIAALVAEGMVRHIGLSNVTAEHLRRASAVHPIAAVQVEWSMWHPIDPVLLEACGHLGTGVVAYSPVGRGFLSGELRDVGGRDFRQRVTRLSGANLGANNQRFEPIRAIAADVGLTPTQLALAWLLHQSDRVVPIPGSRTPAHIEDNVGAAFRVLGRDELARVDEARSTFAAAGRMYER